MLNVLKISVPESSRWRAELSHGSISQFQNKVETKRKKNSTSIPSNNKLRIWKSEWIKYNSSEYFRLFLLLRKCRKVGLWFFIWKANWKLTGTWLAILLTEIKSYPVTPIGKGHFYVCDIFSLFPGLLEFDGNFGNVVYHFM